MMFSKTKTINIEIPMSRKKEQINKRLIVDVYETPSVIVAMTSKQAKHELLIPLY